MTESGFNFRNMLILIGITITAVGIIYFSTEFIDRISDWGRLASVVLLVVIFVSLGAHFESGPESGGLVDRSGWRWLRVTTALYVLGLISALTAVIVFLTMEDIDRIVKVLVTIALGLALIMIAAKRYGLKAQ